VEEWDGIGGVMVHARKWQAAGGRPRGTGTQTVKVNPGKAKLNAVADKKVGTKSRKIVNALYESWEKDGDLTCIKLLFALADGLINCEDPVVMKQLCSYAESLESERQLTDAEAVAATKMELDEAKQRDDGQVLVMTTNTN
jgi:hypothetical protein